MTDTIETKIQELKEHLAEDAGGYSMDELTQLEWNFTRYYAQTSLEMAKVKAERAEKMIALENGHLTQKQIENRYNATPEGKYLVKNEVLLRAVGRLISSIRSRRDEIVRLK